MIKHIGDKLKTILEQQRIKSVSDLSRKTEEQ